MFEPLVILIVLLQSNAGVAELLYVKAPLMVSEDPLLMVNVPVPLRVKLLTVCAPVITKVLVPGALIVTSSIEVGMLAGVQLAATFQAPLLLPFHT